MMPAITNNEMQPKRTRGTPSDNGDFVVFEHVALFDIHTGDDGVHYDERLLTAIADNCNRRIRNTHDYCPVVVGHTRDQDDKRSATDDPPVIGLCGPFYVSDWVNADGKQSKAIFATFWIFPEQEKTFLRNPRRSVEIWPEERPEQRYFDPVSVLGAETPKRDLGLIYSRQSGGRPPSLNYAVPGPLRYSKRSFGRPPIKYDAGGGGGAPVTTPGGGNTFIPGMVSTKKKKHAKLASPIGSGDQLQDDNQSATIPQGEGNMLSPEDLQQIIEALKPTIQSLIDNATANVDDENPLPLEGDHSGLDKGGVSGNALPGDAMMKPPGLPPTGGPPMPGAMPDADASMPSPKGGMPPPDANQADHQEPDEDEEGGPSDEDEDDTPHPDKMSDEDKLYSRGIGRKFMKYLKDGDEEADKFMKGLDKDDSKSLKSYMKYCCDDSKSKEKYAASCGDNMDSDEMKSGEPDRYGKTKHIPPTAQHSTYRFENQRKKENALSTDNDHAVKYSKLREEKEKLAKQYKKLQVVSEELKATCQEQQQELTKLRNSEQCATRYSKLKDLEVQGYVLDPDDEMALTADYSNDQFQRHCEEIVPTRYSKTSNNLLNLGQNQEPSPIRLGMDQKAQKHAISARDSVLRYQKDGKKVDYTAMLKHLIDNDGKIDESKLFSANGNGKSH